MPQYEQRQVRRFQGVQRRAREPVHVRLRQPLRRGKRARRVGVRPLGLRQRAHDRSPSRRARPPVRSAAPVWQLARRRTAVRPAAPIAVQARGRCRRSAGARMQRRPDQLFGYYSHRRHRTSSTCAIAVSTFGMETLGTTRGQRRGHCLLSAARAHPRKGHVRARSRATLASAYDHQRTCRNARHRYRSKRWVGSHAHWATMSRPAT